VPVPRQRVGIRARKTVERLVAGHEQTHDHPSGVMPHIDRSHATRTHLTPAAVFPEEEDQDMPGKVLTVFAAQGGGDEAQAGSRCAAGLQGQRSDQSRP